VKKRKSLLLSLLLVAALVLGMTGNTFAATSSTFKDLKSSHWAYKAVTEMSKAGIVKGYADGEFKPSGVVTYGEFIKMAVVQYSGTDIGNASTGHWASSYYNEAIKQKLFTKAEIAEGSLSKPIPRKDMAIIVASMLGTENLTDSELKVAYSNLKDVSAQDSYGEDVAKAYGFGIITGYSDGSFKPTGTLTRAESATVVYRLIEEDARVIPDLTKAATRETTTTSFSLSNIPAYSGTPYAVVNSNVPYFTESDYTTTSYESYSELDSLGRCGVCIAAVGKDLMPTEERGSIGMVKPTGWHTVKYDTVDGKYLYNRCHLIGFQLTGEDANEKNLITGTRYMNVEGMLPFENMVADYVKETENHVLYRVTPIFEGSNLLASGVLMEAYSVEDSGESIEFNVYCYNVQPDITIDYATGNSSYSGAQQSDTSTQTSTKDTTTKVTTTDSSKVSSQGYIYNTNTKKFHLPGCSSVSQMSEKNKATYSWTRAEAIAAGYSPCGRCNP
jgi:DNA-entry nuclease